MDLSKVLDQVTKNPPKENEDERTYNKRMSELARVDELFKRAQEIASFNATMNRNAPVTPFGVLELALEQYVSRMSERPKLY